MREYIVTLGGRYTRGFVTADDPIDAVKTFCNKQLHSLCDGEITRVEDLGTHRGYTVTFKRYEYSGCEYILN